MRSVTHTILPVSAAAGRIDPMRPGGTAERPAIFFDDADDFRAWLEANHDSASELWMGLNRRHVEPRGLTWEQAVPEALCFGWIDSLSQPIDDDARRQRWTPRKPGSNWSSVNVKLVEALTASGRMHPAGVEAFGKRRQDLTGVYSYETDEWTLPPSYDALLRASPTAAAFWDRATPSYRKMATSWVVTAKQPATRDRRMAQLVEACASCSLIGPANYGPEPRWVGRLRAELS
jgi:uncharacterized protein YdeI (YjbR/CyaY-like superfamily)